MVDDQPVNIQALHAIFADTHDVFMATSGEQALELCAATPPDLVLLDVVMSGVDGLEVCRRLKLQVETRDIPVIFITGHQNASEETACWDAGGVDFINKPINPLTVRNRVRAHLTLKLQADLLRRMVFLDGLTGVANRRHFEERLDIEWRRCRRNGARLAVAMIDVDYFKRYNDAYGHQAGDACLQAVAARIRQALHRPQDLVARYGGEEFVCVLPDTDEQGALLTARRVESEVRSLGIEHKASEAARVVTISIGIACVTPGQNGDPFALVAQADARLYAAKQAGRGCVEGP